MPLSFIKSASLYRMAETAALAVNHHLHQIVMEPPEEDQLESLQLLGRLHQMRV